MAASRQRVFVVGVGMTKFSKPGPENERPHGSYPQMAQEAVTKALLDCGLTYDAVEQAVVGYCYGESTCGQRALYNMGMSGIPIMNVNNNCSTGSTALYMCKQLIAGGVAQCVLALGFEKMAAGSLQATWRDRTNPGDWSFKVMAQKMGIEKAPGAPQLFGNAGVEHMQKYGSTELHFAKIGWKNHKHSCSRTTRTSVNNPYSQFQDEYSLDQVANARKVFKAEARGSAASRRQYLTLLQCCPTSDGAAAAIVCSEAFVHAHGLEGLAVEIVAQEMATDGTQAQNGSMIEAVGATMTQTAAKRAYKAAGITAGDVQVVELHDCFSSNELLTYENLGLCPIGKAGEFIDHGDNTYGGRYVVNPSGGLISKGHPLGATGLAQCAELTWQVRGWAGKRQVPNVRYALQHNLGLGGAVVVTVYKKGFPSAPTPAPDRLLGYNAAAELRGVTATEIARVQSTGAAATPLRAEFSVPKAPKAAKGAMPAGNAGSPPTAAARL